MAKTLLLMRHAKSSWHDKDLPDYQRPLKKSGVEASAEIAEVMLANELVPQLILSSPLCAPAKQPKLLPGFAIWSRTLPM